jgi:hypothetical protein
MCARRARYTYICVPDDRAHILTLTAAHAGARRTTIGRSTSPFGAPFTYGRATIPNLRPTSAGGTASATSNWHTSACRMIFALHPRRQHGKDEQEGTHS